MALELLQLSKTYQGQVVIPEWTQQFEPCETVAIYGGNGSGKSTLLEVAERTDFPDARTPALPRHPLRNNGACTPPTRDPMWTSWKGIALARTLCPACPAPGHAPRSRPNSKHLPIVPKAYGPPASAQLSSGMKQRDQTGPGYLDGCPTPAARRTLLPPGSSRALQWYSSKLLGASLSPTASV